jgi:hypothetical protein
MKKRACCVRAATDRSMLARKNPQSLPLVVKPDGGIQRMIRLVSAGATMRLLAPVAGALLVLVVVWLGFRGSSPQVARDFEECVERVQAKSPSNDELGALMTDCNVRFAGRRKAGGGYSYYDFMQDRSFDIAGPNPTAEERKQIDRAYLGYLDVQRREAVSAELATRQNEQLRADIERARQPVGQPMVLTPTNSSSTAAKRLADRSKATRCVDDSLSCSWARLSTAVKNAFASSARTKP